MHIASQPEQLKSPAVDLVADEAVVKRWRAGHTRGQISVGGALWLTTQRLIFEPHLFESGVMGPTAWSCHLADVTDVGVAPRGCAPFSGAWRRRLALQRGPAIDFFVVNRIGRVVEVIRNALAGEFGLADPR